MTWTPFYKWDYVRYDLDTLKKNLSKDIFKTYLLYNFFIESYAI